MEFLKDLAVPLSEDQFHLLLFVTAISSIVFVPYVGFVLGSSVISVWHNLKSGRIHDQRLLQFSYSVINVALYSKSLILFLALIPGMTLSLSYMQILQQTGSIAAGLGVFGFIFLLIAFILLYSYKYTFGVRNILGALQTAQKGRKKISAGNMIDPDYRESNIRIHIRSGQWGIFTLFISIVFYSCALSITLNPYQWETVGSIFDALFSAGAWLKLLQFFAISASATGFGTLLFLVDGLSKEHLENEYVVLARRTGIMLSVFSLFVLPLIILFNLLLTADEAVSGQTYFLAGFSLLFVFLAAHSIYLYAKTFEVQTFKFGSIGLLIAVSILSIQDFATVKTASRLQMARISVSKEKSLEDLNARFGLVAATFTGEDIYNTRCSSCHLFDVKKIGPPYYETIPKYKGNKAELEAFVLNPTQKNPGYPLMPNPGLKIAEADSVAAFLIRTVAEHFVQKETTSDLMKK
jgi:cytochrome c551/c552